MIKRISLLLLVGAVVFFIAAPAFADFTGTNLVPNASVQDEGALKFFLRGDWGNNKFDDGHSIGFRYGIFENFEIGGSWRLTEDEDFRQDPTFEVKFRFDLAPEKEGCGTEMEMDDDDEGEDVEDADEAEDVDEMDDDDEMEMGCEGCGPVNATGIAVGAWNVNFDEDKNGKIVPYIVYTHDFTGLRGSVGYAFQEDNNAAFTGWAVDAGDGAVRCDWIQANDGEDWNAAVGFQTPLNWDDVIDGAWGIESWLTFSSDDNASDVWTVKLTYDLP